MEHDETGIEVVGARSALCVQDGVILLKDLTMCTLCVLEKYRK